MDTDLQEVKQEASQVIVSVDLQDIGTMRTIAEEAANLIRANCKRTKDRDEVLGGLDAGILMYLEIEYRAKNGQPTVW